MKAPLAILGAYLFSLLTSRAEPSGAPAVDIPPHWSVRIEVLMIAAPQEKMLKILPDLRDDGKIDGAVAELLAAVQRKEATLLGWPIVQTVDRQKAVCETVEEKRFPSAFDPGTKPEAANRKPSSVPDADLTTPTECETRNTGATLEAEAQVSEKGDSLIVNLVAQRVALLGFEELGGSYKVKGGVPGRFNQPQFFTAKVQTSVSIRNGQQKLLAVHVLTKPEGHLEVFILHAVAEAIK